MHKYNIIRKHGKMLIRLLSFISTGQVFLQIVQIVLSLFESKMLQGNLIILHLSKLK